MPCLSVLENNIIQIDFNDLDANNSSVYAVGFLAYLVGDSLEKELKIDTFKVEERRVYEFTF